MTADAKLYFDCTSTIRSGLNTGVQRVVRGLMACKAVFERELAIEFVPICHQIDWYYKLDDALVMVSDGNTRSEFERVSFAYKDIYLCADAFWSMGMTDWLPFISERGATIVNVLYDLIPLEYPEYFEPEAVRGFEAALDEVIRKSDLVACISKQTRRGLRNYLEKKSIPDGPPLSVFDLAPGLVPRNGAVEKDVVVAPPHFLLAVGTLEFRKGIDRLLDEMEIVWSSGDPVTLIIVGKMGVRADQLAHRIRSCIDKGLPLIWRENASDVELRALYQRCEAVVCASRAEGFGLPVAEGLAYGKPVFANRLPVFGEFAGNYPVYFDIERRGELARLIRERSTLKVFDHIPEFPEWEDSVAQLCGSIREVAPLYRLGTRTYKQQTTASSVAWAYQMILGRELDDPAVAEYWQKAGATIPQLRRVLNAALRGGAEPLNDEAVRWTYRILLGQEVDSDEFIQNWQRRCRSFEEFLPQFYADLK